jgi:Zn-finger nucleic acid-binding protein
MICPACGNTLSNMVAGNVAVDVCRGGCGGAWFDNFELKRIDGDGASALAHVGRDPALHVTDAGRRPCPRCDDQPMFRRFYSPKKVVQIDECPNCGGVWLDAGEFEAIQREHAPQKLGRADLSLTISAAVAVVRLHSQG